MALGTGQAFDVGRRGDADVEFVHDRAAEEKFVAEGFGVGRRAVMYNDDWLVSEEGQRAIAGYKIGGEQLFIRMHVLTAKKLLLDAWRSLNSGRGAPFEVVSFYC